MSRSTAFVLAELVLFAIGSAAGPAAAQTKAATPPSLLPGSSSKEPINIDAGKLDYFDKEQKLIYSGGVVAVQGDSTLKASQLTIFLVKDAASPAGKPAAGENAAAANTAAGAGPAAGSSVKKMEAKGPVTLVSKDQVGTGDNGVFDKAENKVTLTGNVTLSQGANVTKGDKLVYDMTSGQAQVFAGTAGRVQSLFVPGSGAPKDPAATPSVKEPKPHAARKAGKP